MSVVFLSTGEPTVDVERLRAIAAKHNVKVPAEEEENYRHLLNGLDATAQQIKDLPEYHDPRLAIDPETLPRSWWKETTNPLNAWSHREPPTYLHNQTTITHPHPTATRLSNLTIAVKDNVSIGGVPLTAGTYASLLSPSPHYPIPTIDAVVVNRILTAGGTITGSATCEHFSMSPLSFTSATGPVLNPWLPSHTTGGSSSGSAALVGVSQVRDWRARHGLPALEDEKLGLGVDMAIGGDQGGSIRIPASYAGVYGLKPTHGLMPYTGIISLFAMIDHAGPMAKSVEDVAALLAVCAGYDGIDPRMTPESPLRENVKDYAALLEAFVEGKKEAGEWTPEKAGKGLRVGVIKESFEVMGLSDEVKSVIEAAIQQFKDVGATVSEVSIPFHLLGPSVWTIATRAGIGSYGLRNAPVPLLNYPMPDVGPPPFNQKAFDILNKHNPAVVNMVFNSTLMNEREDCNALVAKAMMHVHELRAAYDDALKDFDVLITPVNPRVGSKHPEYGMNVEEKMRPAIGATLNTCQFNVTGHPALSMPAGFGKVPDGEGKMPVGMQLVGKRFDEESIFKAAAAWEVAGCGLDKWDGR
ncbi:amidase signature enzyme [Saccharata proteae CBS 121410]|uniref:Amidase signature enzyme n=1 Tax=Saccharata proteae CBS 121410 TaxID=1314787 RepID=A0A9P4I3C6_9PEZI|nr:amidase signature enzyme [Saccharata proteae CBS 121410]